MFDFGLYTQVSDSGSHGLLVLKCIHLIFQIIVGQEPTVHAVGVGGGCGGFPLSPIISFSHSEGDGSI